ncbi:hypothetical protein B0H13DRAFT_2345210 [Mycena leptocephala]|nr:hypothetical protein B0H13DRAFT_2345210 [Mycena leptocephala]
MGRRAKYYSLAQQASASRKSSLNIEVELPAQPPPSCTATQSSISTSGYPPRPPCAPHAHRKDAGLYDQALPHGAQLFEDALRSPDALDESELMRWKEEPPFVQDDDTTDPYSPAYLAFTKSLAEVLHGVRLREQNVRDIELREAVCTKGRGFVMRTLQPEISEMWIRWERTKGMLGERKYHPYHQSREHTMLEHYLQWLARTICHLSALKFLE